MILRFQLLFSFREHFVFFELHKLTERNYNFESEDHKSLRQSWRIDDEEKSISGKKIS